MSQTKAQLIGNVPGGAVFTGIVTTSSVTVSAGTATDPSITFTSDPDTGVFSPGANQLAFSTGGTGRIFIDASGGVKQQLAAASNGGVNVNNGTDDLIAIGTGGFAANGGSATDAGIRTTNNLVFATGSGAPERLRITSAGLVGIGTTTIDEILRINGASNAQSRLRIFNNGTDIGALGSHLGMVGSGLANDLMLSSASTNNLTFGTGFTERARIDSSGRLLVGTNTARANFFNGDVTSQVQVEGTDSNNSAIAVIRNSNESSSPLINFAKSRSASVGGNTVVQDGDNLGTISFQGSDGAQFTPGAYIQAFVDGTPGADDMPGRLVFSTTADGAATPTERMSIDNIGVIRNFATYNNTSGASTANVFVSQFGEFKRDASSIKYKTQVEDMEDCYADAILDIRPVWFRSTCEGDNPDHSHWGFIAEEVAEVDPRLVAWKTVEVEYDEKNSPVFVACDPEPEGVAYDRFVPHLLNLIKRQQQAIETLEAAVTALQQS